MTDRYYHWIIEKVGTGERYEIVKRGRPEPKEKSGYKIIGCCGFHEKERSIKK